jgi:predicted nucleotidyltransferase component of viral defense system
LITLEQLAGFARKNHVGQYYQEKDYLQTVLLHSIYRLTDKVVLKGGTCLKLAYKHPRFSEDLDFNSVLSPKRLQELVHRALKDVALWGMKSSPGRDEIFEGAYTARIVFEGPRFTGSRASTNAVQLDLGVRGGTLQKPRWVQISPEYPDVPIFFVLAMTREEILAEKFRAISMRVASRDVFDAWSLIQAGVKPNRKLIRAKMDLVGVKLGQQALKFPAKAEYDRDLKNLLPMAHVPDYEQVKSDLKRAFGHILEGREGSR